MCRLLPIALIATLLFQSFSKAIIFGAFIVNQPAIARTLCENRSRPEMHCNGKCHLRKQLQRDEQKHGTPQLPASLKSVDEIQFNDTEAFEGFRSPQTGFLFYPEPAAFVSSPQLRAVFHPPTRFALT